MTNETNEYNMDDLNKILDERGVEYKIELEKNAEISFPEYLTMLSTQLGISEEINETEDDGFPIISVLKAFYKIGYYAGCQWTLNDHSDIEKLNFNND